MVRVLLSIPEPLPALVAILPVPAAASEFAQIAVALVAQPAVTQVAHPLALIAVVEVSVVAQPAQVEAVSVVEVVLAQAVAVAEVLPEADKLKPMAQRL